MERSMKGDWRNGKYHGQGTYTSKDGEKFVGEWKDDKEWNGNEYNKDGKIISKYVDGSKEIKIYPPLKPTKRKPSETSTPHPLIPSSFFSFVWLSIRRTYFILVGNFFW